MKTKARNQCLDFLSPLSLIPGFGPKRINALKNAGLETIRDLLYYFPKTYIDRSNIIPISDLSAFIQHTCTVVGTITQTRLERGRKQRLRIQISDNTGIFEALWFHGIPLYRKTLIKGKKILVHGKVLKFTTLQMIHPLVETMSEKNADSGSAFLAQYSLTSVMKEAYIQQKTLIKAIQWIFKKLKHYPQILPAKIENKKSFFPLEICLREIHNPTTSLNLQAYFNRLRYEELYQLALTLRWSRRKFSLPGRSMEAGELPKKMKAYLPFRLTEEQNRAISLLCTQARSTKRMHCLLQGDVGSGKTIVAFFACLPALNEGLQVAWLTPTEILAGQAFTLISIWLNRLGKRGALLKRMNSEQEKRELLHDLKTGKINMVIGTHALLQPSVRFAQIGMIVIDEQHKFGAEQRLILQQKDSASDFLLISATPIPQTLAKTLYGDLDNITLHSLPQERSPVQTFIVPEKKRLEMEEFVAKELIKNKSQAFYLVPRVVFNDENETIKSVTAVLNKLQNGPLSKLSIAGLHGKIQSIEKERIMKDFCAGKIALLVATTIIEVGIDVPNATIMIIENAERFGLSQLHQLRGRVGRGEKKAYTFLFNQSLNNNNTNQRLKEFCHLHDGFKIAELDLSLRGPGETAGFRQSGFNDLQIADIIRDVEMYKEIQKDLDNLLSFQ